MKRWERWSKIIFMGALLAEFLLPSPSAIGARWGARLSQRPTYTALFAAMTTQDFYTPDLLGIDGVVGTLWALAPTAVRWCSFTPRGPVSWAFP